MPRREQTTRETTKTLGVNRSTLRTYVAMGCPVTRRGRGRPNTFDPAKLSAWMRHHDLTGKPGRPTTEKSKTQRAADLRKTNAIADNWELRNANELAELLPTSEVKAAWSRIASATRERVISVAASVSPMLDNMNVTERTAAIDAALREALEGLQA